MSFVNRVPTIVPGFGSPLQNDTLFLTQNVSLTAGPVNTSLAGLTPTISRGYVRVKIYGAGGTTPAVSLMDVVIADGTTFVVLLHYSPAAALTMSTVAASGSPYTNGGSASPAVPGGMEWLIPFLIDINASQVTVNITMTGTSPTAKLDLEVSGVS